MSLLNFGVQLRHALVVERHLTTHQDIENDAKTPNVDLGPGILLRLQQFRSCEIQAPAKRLELVTWREQVAKTKVDDLNVACLANQNVLDLEVAVYDAISVAVVQCTGDLAGELARLLFLQTAMRDDVVEHLSSVDELEEHIPVVVGPHHVSHAADVGVIKKADDGGLSGRTNLLGMVGSLAVGGTLVLVLRLSRYNLHSHLHCVSKLAQYSTVPYGPDWDTMKH
jgi:hypothetical protein